MSSSIKDIVDPETLKTTVYLVTIASPHNFPKLFVSKSLSILGPPEPFPRNFPDFSCLRALFFIKAETFRNLGSKDFVGIEAIGCGVLCFTFGLGRPFEGRRPITDFVERVYNIR